MRDAIALYVDDRSKPSTPMMMFPQPQFPAFFVLGWIIPLRLSVAFASSCLNDPTTRLEPAPRPVLRASTHFSHSARALLSPTALDPDLTPLPPLSSALLHRNQFRANFFCFLVPSCTSNHRLSCSKRPTFVHSLPVLFRLSYALCFLNLKQQQSDVSRPISLAIANNLLSPFEDIVRRLGNPSTLKDNVSFYLTSTSMKVIYRFPRTFQVRYSHLFFYAYHYPFPALSSGQLQACAPFLHL